MFVSFISYLCNAFSFAIPFYITFVQYLLAIPTCNNLLLVIPSYYLLAIPSYNVSMQYLRLAMPSCKTFLQYHLVKPSCRTFFLLRHLAIPLCNTFLQNLLSIRNMLKLLVVISFITKVFLV